MSVAAAKMNVSAMARELRCHPNTLYRYQDEGCPLEEGIEAIKAWRAARGEAKRQAAAENDDLAERKLLAECAKIEAEAEAKELKNQQTRGELMYRDEAIAELAELLTHAKALIEALPDEIAKEMPAEYRTNSRAIAKQQADRFFRLLANWKPGESVDS